jgi:hypothetical protein
MKNPFDSYLERRFGPVEDIPNERPDLLRADSKKRYVKAIAWGAFGLANYVLEGKNYLPKGTQSEAHIANDVGYVVGGGEFMFQGMLGFFQRFRADEISFLALEHQFQEVDDPTDMPPEPPGNGE